MSNTIWYGQRSLEFTSASGAGELMAAAHAANVKGVTTTATMKVAGGYTVVLLAPGIPISADVDDLSAFDAARGDALRRYGVETALAGLSGPDLTADTGDLEDRPS